MAWEQKLVLPQSRESPWLLRLRNGFDSQSVLQFRGRAQQRALVVALVRSTVRFLLPMLLWQRIFYYIIPVHVYLRKQKCARVTDDAGQSRRALIVSTLVWAIPKDFSAPLLGRNESGMTRSYPYRILTYIHTYIHVYVCAHLYILSVCCAM